MRMTQSEAIPATTSTGFPQSNARSRPTTRKNNSLWKVAQRSLRRHWQLYLIMVPGLLYFVVFKYIPMVNAVIAFKDYNVVAGIWGSEWVGLKHFAMFFNNPVFWTLLKNTLVLSVYALLVGFPIPIMLAIALNEVRDGLFKRSVQLVTYAPYFISTVVMVSMIMLLLAPRLGVVNQGMQALGLPTTNLLGRPDAFSSIYVWSGVWQNTGYAAIVYLAALAGIDPTLYEAAKVDGATRLQKIINIDLPGIMPVAVIILILTVGSLLAIGFEKVYLLQNPLNLGASEIIPTYVYKIGLLNANYSFATAVGLFNSGINMVLLVLVNSWARRVSDYSLW